MGKKAWQQSIQLQAWMGLSSWNDVEVQSAFVYGYMDVVWAVASNFNLACDITEIERTYTGTITFFVIHAPLLTQEETILAILLLFQQSSYFPRSMAAESQLQIHKEGLGTPS